MTTEAEPCRDCDCAWEMPRDEHDPGAYPGPDPDCDCLCHDIGVALLNRGRSA